MKHQLPIAFGFALIGLQTLLDPNTHEYHVSGATTWSSDMNVHGKIVVDQGATLTINNSATISFADSKELNEVTRLIVKPGGKLYVNNGATLTSIGQCPGTLWDGVQVQGNMFAIQDPLLGSAQGLAVLSNATIENARVGVLLASSPSPGDNGRYIKESFGGIVQASKVQFRNNRYDVDFTGTSPTVRANQGGYNGQQDYTAPAGNRFSLLHQPESDWHVADNPNYVTYFHHDGNPAAIPQDHDSEYLLLTNTHVQWLNDLAGERWKIGSAQASAWLQALGAEPLDEVVLLPKEERSTTVRRQRHAVSDKPMLLQAYPNPSNGPIYVVCNVPQSVTKASLRIMDLNGRLVHEQVLSPGMGIAELIPGFAAPGIYMAVLSLDDIRAGQVKLALQ